MAQQLTIHLNGQLRSIENMSDSSDLATAVDSLGLKPDRIAIELNGNIVRRTAWPETILKDGDRLEVVHFVGGGSFCGHP